MTDRKALLIHVRRLSTLLGKAHREGPDGTLEGALGALACIRNAVSHNAGDLAKNRNQGCLELVEAARLPGLILDGSVITLEAPFLEYVRLATLAVRMYHGDG